jgi:Bacterial Ig domain
VIAIAKERSISWSVRPLRAGIICAVVFAVGFAAFSSHSGRLTFPAYGPSKTAPSPPLEGSTFEDRTVVIGVDKPDDNIAIRSLAVSQQPEVGRLRVTAGHTLVYAPPPNFNGSVSAGFQACWLADRCGTGAVAITVRAVNDAPVARNDRAITGQGKAVAIEVLANDSDPDGDRLTIRSVSEPKRAGRARMAGNWIVWTPRPRFRGATTIRYVVKDQHGGSSRASVRVRVGPSTVAPSTSPDVVEFFSGAGSAAADRPRDPFLKPVPPAADNGPPQAALDRVSVPAGGTLIIDVLANDRDPDRDRLSIVSVDAPVRGAAKLVGDRIQFSAPLTEGEISFAYSVVDSSGATGWSLVSVSVLQVSHGSDRMTSSRSP